jgi:hypothetical protein
MAANLGAQGLVLGLECRDLVLVQDRLPARQVALLLQSALRRLGAVKQPVQVLDHLAVAHRLRRALVWLGLQHAHAAMVGEVKAKTKSAWHPTGSQEGERQVGLRNVA